ncbi:probable serine/threonine-protein kinase kinX isoform X1 [Scophthalmus maximus]|nr:probable serine/threonine-protein kinase kinX isoform X1 [Scophthalmus maximus]
MKPLMLLQMSLAVTLAVPVFHPDVAQSPDLPKGERSPLLGDSVPLQGHVEVENPAPQARLGSEEQQEKSSPAPVDIERSKSESVAGPEVKVGPQVGEVQTDVKMESELKAEPEDKMEEEGEVQTDVKMESELKAEPEDKMEEEGEVQTDVKMESELKAEPEDEVVVALEAKVMPDVQAEQKFIAEEEVKDVTEVQVEQEVQEKQEVKAERELRAEPEGKPEPQVNPDTDVNLYPDVLAELEVDVKPKAEMEPELRADSASRAEPDVQIEPELQEYPVSNEEFAMAMNLEEEPETGGEVEESQHDVEGNYETVGEPVVEMELPDDGSMSGEEGSDAELSEVEESLRRAFQSQDPVVETLPEEEGLIWKRDHVLGEEPIMDPEPEMRKEPFQKQEDIPDGGMMEEGPASDFMGEPLLPMASYFPNEEASMVMDHEKQYNSLRADGGSDYVMEKEPGSEFASEEEQLSEEPAGEDAPVLDGGVQIGVEKRDLMVQRGYRCSAGVVLEGKCYQFFKGPMRAADAEFFCQAQFPGGHLASITSDHIHRKLMSMMLSLNGAYTRTWIGGLRYLETGRFIWLDGSRWSYADWLSGEPNNTSDLEDCVEVLAFGNGKFNDFTCWEPQAFICSHPYQ